MNYLFAVLLSTLIIWINYCRNPFEFYTDDYQHQYFPVWYEIGRMTSENTFPLITNRIFYGNNLAGEFQYGIFNPAQLIISFFVYQLVELGLEYHLVATLLVYFYLSSLLLIFTGIVRIYSHSFGSLFVASITLVSGGVFYLWFLKNYIPALISFTFFLFFVFLLLKHLSSPKKIFLFLLPISIYLVVSAGWPLQILSLGMTCVVYALFLLLQKRFLKFIEFSFFCIVGALLSLIPILPLLDYQIYEGSRIAFEGRAWSIEMVHIPTFFNPFAYREFYFWNESKILIPYPMLYFSFFLPCVILFSLFKKTKLNQLTILLVVLVLLHFMVACLNLKWTFRFLFRLFPLSLLFFSILLGLKLKEFTKSYLFSGTVIAELYVILLFLLKSFIVPNFFVFVVVLFWLFLREKAFETVIYAVLVGVWIHVNFLKKDFFPYPTYFSYLRNNLLDQKEKRVWFFHKYEDSPYMAQGTHPLLKSKYALSGYSPIGPKLPYCINYIADFYCRDFSLLKALDPYLKQDLLKLLSIEQVIISKYNFQHLNMEFFSNQHILPFGQDYLIVIDPNYKETLLHTTPNLKLEMQSFGEYWLQAKFQKTNQQEAVIILPWVYSKNYRLRTQGTEVQKSMHSLVQIYIPKEVQEGKIDLSYEYPNKKIALLVLLLVIILYSFGTSFLKFILFGNWRKV